MHFFRNISETNTIFIGSENQENSIRAAGFAFILLVKEMRKRPYN